MSRFTLALIVTTVLLVRSLAIAQEDPSYRTTIAEAVAEFNAGRFEEARALFLRAHALAPSARTLRGVGMAAFELRDYVEAHRSLTAALDASEGALDDAARAEIVALLERTRTFVGRYRLDGLDVTRVRVDGALADPAVEGELVLAIGDHDVTARTADGREARGRVRVRGGEQGPLVLEATPPSTDEAAEPRSLGAGPVPASTRTATESRDGVLAITLIAVGGAALAGSLLTAFAGWLTRDEELRACTHPPVGSACDNGAQLTLERDLAAGVTVALGLIGAVGLGLGAWLAAAPPSHGGLACAPTLGGAFCGARF